MESPRLCRLPMLERIGLWGRFVLDCFRFRGDGERLLRHYKLNLMGSMRKFSLRNKRYIYEVKVRAPRLVIRNELRLILTAIYEMARWEYLCKLAGRWANQNEGGEEYAKGDQAH